MNTARPTLWRDRGFAVLITARAVSALGNGIGRVALTFGILAAPGMTATRLSLVLACQALPQLLVVVGGMVSDRIPRRRVLVFAELIAGLAWTGIALTLLVGTSSVVPLAMLAAITGLAAALYLPAFGGAVPELVELDRLRVANALMRTAYNGGLILGAALAGVMVTIVGAGWAIAIIGVSYLLSACLLASLR